jgi:hypothetical protein
VSPNALRDTGPAPELDPGTIVRVLNLHGVRYVVIGGIAAEIHDLPVPATVDIDVTPSRDRTNLERLARAFDELDAGLYTAEEAGTWFPRTPVELWSQYDTLHLMTNAGPIDIVFAPDGGTIGLRRPRRRRRQRPTGRHGALATFPSGSEAILRFERDLDGGPGSARRRVGTRRSDLWPLCAPGRGQQPPVAETPCR